MIYSRWRPDRGGYDYYESDERFGLGDDLPVPSLPAGTSIGVASVDAGRRPSKATVAAGSGPLARGMILPTSRAGLEGVGAISGYSGALLLALGAALAWVGCKITGRRSG
jgi:hypothetical protein